MNLVRSTPSAANAGKRQQHHPQAQPLHGSWGNYGSVNSLEDSAAGETEDLLGEDLLYSDKEEDATPGNSGGDLRVNSLTYSMNESEMQYSATVADTDGGSTLGDQTTLLVSRRWKYVALALRGATVIFIVICMITLTKMLSPPESRPVNGDGKKSSSTRYKIPFTKVHRDNYDDPVSNFINVDLFHRSLLNQNSRARNLDSEGNADTNGTTDISPESLLNVPFPTGAFWTNLVVKSPMNDDLSFAVVTYPYAFKWSPSCLQASYPALRRQVDSMSIRDRFEQDLTFGTTEDIAERHVMGFDSLSVTVRFRVNSDAYWESYLVQGSPYVTAKYHYATPVLTALSTFRTIACPAAYEDPRSGSKASMQQSGDDAAASSNSTFKRILKGRRMRWGVCTPSSGTTGTNRTSSAKYLHGVQFVLQTQEGLTWMLFSSEPITLAWNFGGKHRVSTLEPFSGVLRLALIPPSSVTTNAPTGESASVSLVDSTGYRRLVYHAGVYPVGGHVSWEVRPGSSSSSVKRTSNNGASRWTTPPANRVGTVGFHFDTMSMSDTSNSNPNSRQSQLLMLALPHHVDVMPSDTLLYSDKFDLLYQSIKGPMTPIVADTWAYEEQLTPVGFDDIAMMQKIAKGTAFTEQTRDEIMQNVASDVKMMSPSPAENVYGYGKQAARLAQLAHIADVILTSSDSNSTKLRRFNATLADAVDLLHSSLTEFLTGEITDKLLFDADLGGIVTVDGLFDSGADFGSGRYNDHHFHYGYILYACAILGRLDPSFVANYGDFVDCLLFDVAYSSNPSLKEFKDALFPFARHKSWFDGHSFASGLFPMANGKSQESSSEAVNCYYGAYLWSLVRYSEDNAGTNNDLADFARLLLSMEIRGAKKYWHMMPSAQKHVYDGELLTNYMVGNLGMTDVVCETWFGTKSLYVQMINFMPVTGVTSELFNDYRGKYIEEEYETLLAPLMPDVEMAWRGYVICDHALHDPEAAWDEALRLDSAELDPAVSKSQVLYWINSQASSNFVPESSSAPSADNQSTDNAKEGTSETGGASSCQEHPTCAAIGLEGQCCPTSMGVNLECCNSPS